MSVNARPRRFKSHVLILATIASYFAITTRDYT